MKIEIIKTYHDNGKISNENSFLNGKYHGIQKRYYYNGIQEVEYYKMNYWNYGLIKWWNRYGERNMIVTVKKSQTHGIINYFNYRN
jgi:antitoxin component YwqK of YwqJK toxin-antitoxin module